LIRKTEADEEHLFLNLLKTQKRLNEDDASLSHSDRHSDSGASTSRLSYTISGSGVRTPAHGSVSHSCTASNTEDDNDDEMLN
jgi:hypothetical protein